MIRVWTLLPAVVLCLLPAASRCAAAPVRGLKICVAADAPGPVRHAAESLLAAARSNPLLSVFCDGRPPAALTDTNALLADKPAARAYDHLVLVGLSNDPMVRGAWQHEARADKDDFYVFGFGYLSGDIGYVESDRNPFLHGRAIPKAPYESEVVTITGSTPAGVALAADAFLRNGLINGVVAGRGWKRSRTGLLDRDPLQADFAGPQWLPARSGAAQRIGLSQAGEDEYRGVLEDAGVEPHEIWRVKYYVAGAWDGAGAEKAFDDYAAGLHRRAYGNTVWCAKFASPAEAGDSAREIAGAAHLARSGDGWSGTQPPYSSEKTSPGGITLWQRGEWILMSTLSSAEVTALRNSMR